MKPRICICCGEPMIERGNALSRNPNICASCSSLADGIEDTVAGELSDDEFPKSLMVSRSGVTEEEPFPLRRGTTSNDSGASRSS